MLQDFMQSLFKLAIDMGFYMMIGLLLVGVLNIFMKREWIAKHLGGAGVWQCVKASILGVPLPLCSCGVVPTGLYLREKGASKASAVSFLISTPQTGADSIIATYGLMGPLFAWYRPLAAFISGVIGGIAVKIFNKEEPASNKEEIIEEEIKPLKQRTIDSIKYIFGEFIDDISVHFVIGLIVAALIAVLIPADFLMSIGLGSGIISMLLMIALGAPMYICSTSSIPIAVMLMAKGLSPGAAFVFLFMGPFTNAASLIMISKKFGKKTTITYFVSSALAAIGFGLLLDYIVDAFGISIAFLKSHQHEMIATPLQIVVGSIFLLFVLYYLVRRIVNYIKEKKAKKMTEGKAGRVYYVDGMTCGGCAAGLETAMRDQELVDNAEIVFEESKLTIWGSISDDDIKKVVESHGYKLKD